MAESKSKSKSGTSTSKTRQYVDDYIKYGFTFCLKQGIEYPQCVICYKVLGNDSMKPCKLQNHLAKIHPSFQKKNAEFFKSKLQALKVLKLDNSGRIHQAQSKIVEASYKVSYIIAQKRKPHTLGEEVIMPCAKEIVRLLIGEEAVKKVDNISLSNSTVKRRITDLSLNIKENVVAEVKRSTYFSIQLDEATDVSSLSQLMVFCRYIFENQFKEELLFSSALETTTKATDILELVQMFFDDNQLEWKNVLGMTTDGAPAMLGCKSGLQTKVKELAPHIVNVHCFIHRQALACKTLPDNLKMVFQKVIKLVNHIKSSALNTRLFAKFCSDQESEHKTLLYYTAVRWLSAGKFLERFFELRNEVKNFLINQKSKLAEYFELDNFDLTVAYLVDIMGHLNKLNLQLQGKNANLITHSDKLNTFIEKLTLYKTRIEKGNLIMFENLKQVVGKYPRPGFEK